MPLIALEVWGYGTTLTKEVVSDHTECAYYCIGQSSTLAMFNTAWKTNPSSQQKT